MSEFSRRDFMALSGLAAGSAALAGCAPGDSRSSRGGAVGSGGAADLIVTNANVYTIDEAAPQSGAFA